MGLFDGTAGGSVDIWGKLYVAEATAASLSGAAIAVGASANSMPAVRLVGGDRCSGCGWTALGRPMPVRPICWREGTGQVAEMPSGVTSGCGKRLAAAASAERVKPVADACGFAWRKASGSARLCPGVSANCEARTGCTTTARLSTCSPSRWKKSGITALTLDR